MVAHRAIESVTLDKHTMHEKEEIIPKYSKLIYNGYWYSKARFKLQKIVDLKRNKVNGSVKLKLYKGNITILSRNTKNPLRAGYSPLSSDLAPSFALFSDFATARRMPIFFHNVQNFAEKCKWK